MGSMLLAHIDRNKASQFGVSIKEEAVIQSTHVFLDLRSGSCQEYRIIYDALQSSWRSEYQASFDL